MKYLSLVFLMAIALVGCEKGESVEELQAQQAQQDDEIIINYLEENGLEAEKHSSGIYFTIIEPGTGEHPASSSTVEVKYKGYLTDKTVFDQTAGDNTFEYPLSGLIPGWQIGIPLLKKGGKGILYIPSGLGYGTYSIGSIPANSVLIFDIELVDFSN